MTAVAGCTYVLHVASPFPSTQPKDPDELIVPAREGTLRVLKASLAAGVKRIVVTSSIAAIERAAGTPPGKVLDEDDWTDPASPKASAVCQVEDDRRAGGLGSCQPVWRPGAARGRQPRCDYRPDPHRGPLVLDPASSASTSSPGCLRPPRRCARSSATTPGKCRASTLRTCSSERWDCSTPASARSRASFGLKTMYSADRAKSVFGWRPRPVEESVIDCARSLIELGVVESSPAA